MIMNSYSSEEQYQNVKEKIYGIVSDSTKENLFHKENYYGPFYPYIDYRIVKVRLVEIKGLNHFIFEITFTVKDCRTVESIIYIVNGVIYNSHRK